MTPTQQLFSTVAKACFGAALFANLLLIAGFADWLNVPTDLTRHLIAAFVTTMLIGVFFYAHSKPEPKPVRAKLDS